ncbi:DUF6234 family protein [Kitasatospora sp. NPDC051914]|uniref:DUF6234 family protein n=1 Tax=Kitasatospora sp. NPDC051914 TaxID=3154945 RepID=UPI0034445BF4
MTSTTPASQSPRRSGHRAGDLLMAVVGLVVAAAFLGNVLLAVALKGWAGQHEGAMPGTGKEAVLAGVVAIAAGAVAHRLRRQAPITATVQGFVAVAAGLLALVLAFAGTHQERPAPAPTKTTEQIRPGYGPCRSGGTNDECINSGG